MKYLNELDMPRGKKKENPSALVKALRFVSHVQKSYGPPDQQYCWLINKQCIAFNGVVMMSHPTDQEFNIRPHTLELLSALESFIGTVSITQSGGGINEDPYLVIKDDKDDKTIFVPCLRMSPIPFQFGNENLYVDTRVVGAIIEVSQIVIDSAALIRDCCIKLDNSGATATNGNLILQAFTGTDFYTPIYLPRAFSKALGKLPTENILACFHGNFTFTLVCPVSGVAIGTQCYDMGNESYPDVSEFITIEGGEKYLYQILDPGKLLKGVSSKPQYTVRFKKALPFDKAIIENVGITLAELKANLYWEGTYNMRDYIIASKYMALVTPHRVVKGAKVTSFMTADYKLRGAIPEL